MSVAMGRDAVVFLHGRGLGPETAAEVAGALPAAELLAPTGGVALRRSQTWFENERIGVARPQSIAEAVSRLIAWCDGPPLRGRPAWLCGFSNGGALAAHLLIHHPDRFLGAALLCAPIVLPPWPDAVLHGKPVLYAHGDVQDTVVPQAFYSDAEAYLSGPSGATAAIRRHDVGHVIAPAMVADLAGWFGVVKGMGESA